MVPFFSYFLISFGNKCRAQKPITQEKGSLKTKTQWDGKYPMNKFNSKVSLSPNDGPQCLLALPSFERKRGQVVVCYCRFTF